MNSFKKFIPDLVAVVLFAVIGSHRGTSAGTG